MSSFQRFLRYLQNHPGKEADFVDTLHKIIFSSPRKEIISATTIAKALGITIFESIELLFRLYTEGVIELEKFECHQCGCLNDVPTEFPIVCEHCGAEVAPADLYFFSQAVLSDKDSLKLLEQKIIDRDTFAFADSWQRNKSCFYVITDLTSSQKVQEISDEVYTQFLAELRDEIRASCFSEIKKEYIALGEIGDAIKMAFIDPLDAWNYLKNISRIIGNVHLWGKYSAIKEAVPLFPQLGAVFQKIPLPRNDRNETIPTTRVIGKTLSGAYDFNTISLTEFYRLESSIKYNKELLPPADIQAWFFRNAGDSLPDYFESFRYINHEPKCLKHGISLSNEIALVLFSNGIPTFFNTPSVSM